MEIVIAIAAIVVPIVFMFVQCRQKQRQLKRNAIKEHGGRSYTPKELSLALNELAIVFEKSSSVKSTISEVQKALVDGNISEVSKRLIEFNEAMFKNAGGIKLAVHIIWEKEIK